MLLSLDTHSLFLFPADDAEDIARYALKPVEGVSYDGFFTLEPQDTLTLEDDGSGTRVTFQGRDIGVGDTTAVHEFKEHWDSCLKDLSCTGEVKMPPSFLKHLKDRENEFIEEQELKFRYLTWNLGGGEQYDTEKDLSELFLGEFDVLFVAFQEIIPLNAKNFRSSRVPVDKWIVKVLSIIGDDYHVMQTNKLIGLASILFVKRDRILNFHDLEIESIGTGVLNLFGNKGAISTSFTIRGYNFTLLDCHFAAGESDQFLLRRRRELDAIHNYIKLPASNGKLISSDRSILFDMDELEDELRELEVESDVDQDDASEIIPEGVAKVAHCPDVGDSDRDKNIIFIGGDLNYRVKCSREMASMIIKQGSFESLLEYDTLKMEQAQGRILQDFHEGDITFLPSYKIDKVTGEFENDRIPSYTDRIFHSASSHVKIESYRSPEITLSDHRPVLTDYTISLPLINNIKRDSIVTSLLKNMDEQENTKRTTLEIKDLESEVSAHILNPSTIHVKLTNVGAFKTYWEIMDTLDTIDSKFDIKTVKSKVEPQKGVLPRTGEQILSFTATLPVGCQSLSKTVILRGYNAQDYFLTLKWVAQPTCFGKSLDELDVHGAGIPSQIYSLIQYLSKKLRREMFNDRLMNFTQELERKIIFWIDEDKQLDVKELKQADQILDGSSSIAVARVLLLLLDSLDGGIVSEDLSTYLLDNFQDDDQVMERVLENLPPLRANVLIYIGSFLRLCTQSGFDREQLMKTFEPLLLQIPSRRKRDVLLGRKNYEKLRSEFMDILIS